LAAACLENAEALLSDSELLLEHERHASAVAWALLALEEFGKHMLCSFALTISLDDADAWRAFWRRWRAHPTKLRMAAGQFIDLVAEPGASGDELWRQAYDGLRSQIPAMNRWKQDAIYVDWNVDEPVNPAKSVEYGAACALIRDVGVVIRSGRAMSGDADLGEVWERSATTIRDLMASMSKAIEEDDEEAYFKVFEDFVRENAPPEIAVEEVIDDLRRRRRDWLARDPARVDRHAPASGTERSQS
jgi:AbiV family abortive infection protein